MAWFALPTSRAPARVYCCSKLQTRLETRSQPGVSSGFKAPVAHSANHFSKSIAVELGLKAHGLEINAGSLPCVGLSSEGRHVFLNGAELWGVSDDERAAYARYSRQLRRFARALEPFWLKTMPRIGHNKRGDLLTFGHMGLNLRRLGKADLREFLRVFSLPMRDLMEENFDSDTLKSLLSWDGLIGSKMRRARQITRY